MHISIVWLSLNHLRDWTIPIGAGFCSATGCFDFVSIRNLSVQYGMSPVHWICGCIATHEKLHKTLIHHFPSSEPWIINKETHDGLIYPWKNPHEKYVKISSIHGRFALKIHHSGGDQIPSIRIWEPLGNCCHVAHPTVATISLAPPWSTWRPRGGSNPWVGSPENRPLEVWRFLLENHHFLGAAMWVLLGV